MDTRNAPPIALDASTLPPSISGDSTRSPAGLERDGLALLWSRDAPDRVGELLLLPPGDPGPWTFGRGEARGDERRLSLVRQIPGAVLPAGPLACPRISRAQLHLWPAPGGGILIENVGSCPLVYRGRDVASAEVAPGETLSLRNELLFLCIRRAPIAPAPSEELAVPVHPFGGPDAAGMVGESAVLWELRHRIVAVARQGFHVLILGESGSGKELVAQAIHARSARSQRRMVSRNAATIPDGLADAELFGNVRSYPNPGMPERPGLVGEAHQSSLFLDEFADLPSSLQAHLLRVMDSGEYQRLGEATTRKADLRILAATNRPESDIRHDVLARFKVRVAVPDLHRRREDIPLLAAHLLREHAASDSLVARRFFAGGDLRSAPLFSPGLMEALVQHRYTTHVRELAALLVHAALEGRGHYLELGPELKRALQGRSPPGPAPEVESLSALTPAERSRLSLLRRHRFSPTACGRDPAYPGNRQTADLHLRQLLCTALRIAGWDTGRAADLLAGDGDRDLREKSAARMATFLSNLRARVEGEAEGELRRALIEEWKGSAEGVLLVMEALRAGRIASPSPGSALADNRAR
jgi:two-component system nitrogen regulation response regulator GlnG/two-component system response regulator HydG